MRSGNVPGQDVAAGVLSVSVPVHAARLPGLEGSGAACLLGFRYHPRSEDR